MTSLATNMSVRTNLQYIAVAEMRNEVFQYSTSTVNFRTTGTFTAPYIVGATQAVSIPAGTILVETGRKLFRGANPNVPTFLVQVMAFTNGSSTDGRVVRTPGNGQSLLDATDKAVFGFIDPSSPNVALYSVERNPDHADGLYYSSLALLTAGGAATTAAGYAAAGGVAHKGPSLFTGGTATAANVVSTGQIRSSTVTPLTAFTFSTGSATVDRPIDPSLGQVFTLAVNVTGGTNALTISSSATPLAGSVVYLIITTAGTHSTAVSLSAGANVKLNTTALGTAASKTFGFTFVSDGTNLVQVGGDVVPVAM